MSLGDIETARPRPSHRIKCAFGLSFVPPPRLSKPLAEAEMKKYAAKIKSLWSELELEQIHQAARRTADVRESLKACLTGNRKSLWKRSKKWHGVDGNDNAPCTACWHSRVSPPKNLACIHKNYRVLASPQAGNPTFNHPPHASQPLNQW